MIPLLIEYAAVPAISSIVTIQQCEEMRKSINLAHHLDQIGASIEKMASHLGKITMNFL